VTLDTVLLEDRRYILGEGDGGRVLASREAHALRQHQPSKNQSQAENPGEFHAPLSFQAYVIGMPASILVSF
jgi:hypothetical protein